MWWFLKKRCTSDMGWFSSLRLQRVKGLWGLWFAHINIVTRFQKGRKSIPEDSGGRSFWLFFGLFLGTVHSERQLLDVKSGVTLNPLEYAWSPCDLTCREGWALKTPRRCRGLSTFLNSLDDMTSYLSHPEDQNYFPRSIKSRSGSRVGDCELILHMSWYNYLMKFLSGSKFS